MKFRPSLTYAPKVTIRSNTPEMRMEEKDQTDPAGRWRWVVSGDVLILARSAASAWGSDTDWVTLDYSADQITFGKAVNLAAAITIDDDVLFGIGTDDDQVFVNRSSALAANTVLTGILEGTPVTPAIAANSLIISNVTNDGDILIAASDGGNSTAAIWVDGSVPTTNIYNLVLANAGYVTDDILFGIGTSSDGVLVNVSAGLAADTALAGVLIGVPDTPALAANSLIIVNATADGDILIAGNDGGNSRTAVFFDSSVGNLYLGKPGTPGYATGVGDVYVGGRFETSGDGANFGTATVAFGNTITMADDKSFSWGTGNDIITRYNSSDGNAKLFAMSMYLAADANNVPVFALGNLIHALDTGLFDGVTQPALVSIEKDAKYTSGTAATAAGAQATMIETAKFGSSVVGDIVRVISGTNTLPGWYWITTVTDADTIVLDRNWCSGAVTAGVWLAYHDFTMLSADGVCTRITDGAPTDASVEIDRDGWIIIDVGNNLLYWRSQAAWKCVLPDGGVKSVIVPFVDGTAATATGWDVDAAGEYAYAFGAIPAECNEVISIIIRGRAITTDGANEMVLDIDIGGGADNEGYATEVYTADDIASDTVPSANDDIVTWTVTDAGVVGSGGLSAGDSFYVSAIGAPVAAPDIATDCHFQSVEVKYK